jgi:hypothetical protein
VGKAEEEEKNFAPFPGPKFGKETIFRRKLNNAQSLSNIARPFRFFQRWPQLLDFCHFPA